MSTATNAAPAALTAVHAADLTPDERRILAAYRTIPGNDRKDLITRIVESFAENCPRDKRPALHLVRGGAV